MSADRQLWNDYRATWAEFSRRLQHLQNLPEQAEYGAREAAWSLVENARFAHNEARDRLAQHLTIRSEERAESVLCSATA